MRHPLPDFLVCVNEVLSSKEADVVSNHSVVCFELSAFVKASWKFQHSVFDYAKADFEGLHASLNAFGLSTAIADNSGIDTEWQIWKDTFLAALVDNIPPKTLRGHNPVPCIKDAILTLIKKKEKVNL